VSEDEGRQLAQSNEAAWLELSTTNDDNVCECYCHPVLCSPFELSAGKIFALCLDQIEANDIVEAEHTPLDRTNSLIPPQLPPLTYIYSSLFSPGLNKFFASSPTEELSQVLSNVTSNSNPPDLTGLVTRLHNFPSACGGFADVWEANLDNVKVAVKVLRSFVEGEKAKLKLKKASLTSSLDCAPS
jgi:hypothetical protein